MLNFPIDYMNDLNQSFKTSIEPAKDNYRILRLTKIFPDGCQVVIESIFLDVREPGVFNLYLAEIATLGSDGEISDECYRKGYASSALSEFLKISDRYKIEIDLTAASQDKERFPNRKLVDFYQGHGFEYGGNPNKGWVEMSRDRKKEDI